MLKVLPIVGRELRVAARQRSTYRMRVVMALVALAVLGWMLMALLPQSGVPSGRQGVWLFRGLLVAATFYGLIAAVASTADSISREKREGTLGLLFLTDLRAYDVVLGKLTASGLRVLYAVWGVIPVLALSIQLGGVTAAEIGLAAVTLVNTLFFALAVGTLVSALSRNERKAMSGAFLVLVVLSAGPFVLLYGLASVLPPLSPADWVWMVSVLALSPVYPFLHLFVGATPWFGMWMGRFWVSTLWVHGMAWGVLVVTCGLLPRVWRARESASPWAMRLQRLEQWVYGRGLRRQRLRRRLLEANPVLWLLHRERGKPYYPWLYFGVVLSVWIVGNSTPQQVLSDLKSALPGLMLITAFLKVWVVSESCTQLAEDRRLGALESLLTTPLADGAVARGHWLAVRRQFGWPLLIFCGFQFWVLSDVLDAGVALGATAVLLADLTAVVWTGMWLGLTTRSVNRASLYTVGLILVLPWGLFSLVMLGLSLIYHGMGQSFSPSFESGFYIWCLTGLAVDATIGWGWARGHLRRDLRRVASEGRWGGGGLGGARRWFSSGAEGRATPGLPAPG